ncbi:MAG TPA: hypothetical protein VLH75_12950 [Longimicrobiales bacterium]|nr:hypothetical protein [Longimicrobiales bacterium]
MYQPMLFLHWKQIRAALLPLVVAAFALPLLSVQGLGSLGSFPAEPIGAYQFMMNSGWWAPVFPTLAAVIGVTLALSSWNWDHQLNHVYALSLPVPRWRYAALKMGAGVVLAFVPALAFWGGAHLAAASVALPPGLHAYPNALAVRFLFSVLVSYAVLFAMAAGTVRTTLVLVTALFVFMLVGGSANEFLGRHFEYFQRVNVVEAFFQTLVSRNGPFEVFSGSWLLIDV